MLSEAVKVRRLAVTDSPDPSLADSGVLDDCFLPAGMVELRPAVQAFVPASKDAFPQVAKVA